MICLPIPPAEELLRWVSYDPESGVLTRIADPVNRQDRCKALSHTNGRAHVVKILGVQYLTARVAWRIMTGNDPGELEVDHRNRDYLDDRWSNLRLSCRTDQMANIPLRKDNKFGIKGVIPKKSGTYQARLRRNGREYWSPEFNTAEEAGEAYRQMAILHHGEFAHTPDYIKR